MSFGGPSHSALACRARRRCHAAPEATPSYNRPDLDAVDATAMCDVSVKRWEGCPQARKRKRGKSERPRRASSSFGVLFSLPPARGGVKA